MAGKKAYTNEKIIAALRKTNGLVSLAAKDLGCSPQTIYNRAGQVKAVQQVIDECREELVDYAELALRSALLSSDPWAVQFTLRTLGKNRGYIERKEISGPDGGPIENEQHVSVVEIVKTAAPTSIESAEQAG